AVGLAAGQANEGPVVWICRSACARRDEPTAWRAAAELTYKPSIVATLTSTQPMTIESHSVTQTLLVAIALVARSAGAPLAHRSAATWPYSSARAMMASRRTARSSSESAGFAQRILSFSIIA